MTPHLYIHIPFCESKCPYCAFKSGVFNNIDYSDYINTILKTIPSNHYESIYIGGGTPSVIPSHLYEPIFNKLNANEITIEANPSSATLAWLRTIRQLGANRLSLGVQSVRDDKLQLLGRGHNSKQAKEAVRNAHSVGFERISIDLMYDTALDSLESISAELDEILTWNIDHISLYALTIEDGTPFSKRLNVQKPNEDVSFMIANKLVQNGFEHYEVASFGKTKCKHNLGYWSGNLYDGVGFGAVGFDGTKRYSSSAANVYEYMSNPNALEYENISHTEHRFEQIFLGLRSILGVGIDVLDNAQLQKCELLESEGRLIRNGNRFYNTNFWLSDEIALFLI